MLPSTTFPPGVSTLHTDASGSAPPDAFGPFRVLHQIGVGVLGPVFRAYQPDPGRLVAVKQFRLDVPPESAHRFVAALEQLIAADLTHLGIAAPLAAGLVDNSPYLAMDFAAAESFDVVVRDYGPAPVSEALRIATQLGGALDFAAAVDVFHGSLHPRDVLVSTDDTRVTGLGIAHALEEIGVLPPIRRPYTAPERVAGLAWDRRADTFSLAALVYEMLFGRRIAGLGSDAAEAIPSNESLDVHSMRALFARALAEDPAERFETALSFADALHNAAAQPPSPAKPARSRRKAVIEPPPPETSRPEPPALPLEPQADLPLAGAGSPLALGLDLDAHPLDVTPAAEKNASEVRHQLPIVLPEMAPDFAAPQERTVAPQTPDEPPLERTVDDLPQLAGSIEESRESDAAVVETVDDVPPAGPALDETFDEDALSQAEADRFLLADEGLTALPELAAATVDTPPVRDLTLGKATAAASGADQPVRRQSEPEPPVPPAAPPPPPPTLSSVALEQSRSAIWPLALALIVGLLVGFAFGYGTGTRDRAASPSDVTASRDEAPGDTDAASSAAAPTAPAVTPPAATPPAATAPAADANRSGGAESAGDSGGRTGAAGTAASRPSATDEPAEPTPPRAAPTSGRLLVRSSPAGARVLLDGRDVGETPLTLPEVAFGSHVVRIAHQGYVAAERRVRIRSAQPAQSIEVDLAAARPARGAAPAPASPESSSGSLMVDSRPIGARVFVDERMVGTTPLLLDSVSAGEHRVRLEMDGFGPWATTTRVAGGQRNRVSGSLEQR